MKRVLVVAPRAVVVDDMTWSTNAARNFPRMRVVELSQGSTKDKAAQLARIGDGVVVVTWDSVWREPLATAVTKHGFELVIADEIHMMKSPSGKRAKFMLPLAKQPGVKRLGLSGTPVGQTPMDVWAPYQFLVPGDALFPRTYSQFRMRYTRPAMYSEYRDRDVIITSGRGNELMRWKLRDLDDLHERMYRVASRIRTEDVIDQTPATWEELHCTLEPAARRLYSELDREFMAEVQSTAGGSGHVFTAANAMTKVLHLQQLTGGALRDEDGRMVVVSEAKRDRLAEWLDGVGDEPVVVFARFHHDLDAIHEACALAGLTSSELSGRRAELTEWKAGETQVIAVQEQVGGAGIDLTRARLCVYFSLSYSLLDFEQSKARVRGPAQTRTAAMYALVAMATVDEEIFKALEAGQEVVDALVERRRR